MLQIVQAIKMLQLSYIRNVFRTAIRTEFIRTNTSNKKPNQDDQENGKVFDDMKTTLLHAPSFEYFDPARDLVLQCDASESGVEAWLLQDDQSIVWDSSSLKLGRTISSCVLHRAIRKVYVRRARTSRNKP